MILTGNNKVDEILAVIDGKRPSAVNHPLRAELTKPESGFEPVAAGFLDMAALPPLPPEAVKLGLDGVKRIDATVGLPGRRSVERAPCRGSFASARSGLLCSNSPRSGSARCHHFLRI